MVKIKKRSNFYYLELGSRKKETILLLPGYSDSSIMFGRLGNYLKSKYHFIVLDFPIIHEANKIMDVRFLADFVDGFVEKLGLQKFILTGFSFGGIVAIKYALLYPEKIRELYLLNSFPQYHFSWLGKRLYKLFKPLLLTKWFCHLYLYFNTNKTIRRLANTEPISQARVERMKKFPVSIFGTLFNALDYQLSDEFSRLNIPKTMVLFKDDKVLKWRKYKNFIDSFNCNFICFKQGGHAFKDIYWKNVKKIWL